MEPNNRVGARATPGLQAPGGCPAGLWDAWWSFASQGACSASWLLATIMVCRLLSWPPAQRPWVRALATRLIGAIWRYQRSPCTRVRSAKGSKEVIVGSLTSGSQAGSCRRSIVEPP